MHFGLTNAPATFEREINRIHRPVLGIELVINTEIHIDQVAGIVVVAFRDDIHQQKIFPSGRNGSVRVDALASGLQCDG